jgi:hypothetical protein
MVSRCGAVYDAQQRWLLWRFQGRRWRVRRTVHPHAKPRANRASKPRSKLLSCGCQNVIISV